VVSDLAAELAWSASELHHKHVVTSHVVTRLGKKNGGVYFEPLQNFMLRDNLHFPPTLSEAYFSSLLNNRCIYIYIYAQNLDNNQSAILPFFNYQYISTTQVSFRQNIQRSEDGRATYYIRWYIPISTLNQLIFALKLRLHTTGVVRIAVIGGTGLQTLPGYTPLATVNPSTPWGRPSAPIHILQHNNTPIAFLSRHGASHEFAPHEVPNRANIAALRSLGVRTIIAFSAVGSLQEEIRPRDFVVPDQVIDRTKGELMNFVICFMKQEEGKGAREGNWRGKNNDIGQERESVLHSDGKANAMRS
jgi:hypothetical protein